MSDLLQDLPSGDEATGTTLNPQEGGKMLETSIIVEMDEQYAKHIRSSYAIKNTGKAGTLKKVRTVNRNLHAAMTAKAEEMESSLDGISDDLDRLTMADDIKVIKDQLDKLDDIYTAIDNQVKVLLNA